MTVRTRSQLKSDADSFLADNTSGDISPQDVRDRVKDLADSATFPEDLSNATTSTDGLMSKEDKTKLDGLGNLTVNLRIITSSTTYTPTAGTKFVWGRIQAAGGGGGGADGAGESNRGVVSAGGSGGEAAEWVWDAAQLGANAAITIGSAGSAGSNSGGSGGNASASSINPAGTGDTVTVNGGPGGSGTGSNSNDPFPRAPGGPGTGGSGGAFHIPGEAGLPGLSIQGDGWSGPVAVADGGSSYLGIGGRGGVLTDTDTTDSVDLPGVDGAGYGGGGSGAFDNDTSGSTGGAGAPGVCIIMEFIEA